MMENDDTPAESRLPNFETKPFDFLSILEGIDVGCQQPASSP